MKTKHRKERTYIHISLRNIDKYMTINERRGNVEIQHQQKKNQKTSLHNQTARGRRKTVFLKAIGICGRKQKEESLFVKRFWLNKRKIRLPTHICALLSQRNCRS